MIANGAAAALEACEELRVVSLDIRGVQMYLVERATVTQTFHRYQRKSTGSSKYRCLF